MPSIRSVDIQTQNLSLAYEDDPVIRDLSLAIPAGEVTALVGRNGSGKSTLLRGLARLMKPTRGAVYLDGQTIHHLSTRLVARRLAMLPQRPDAPDGLTVRELVAFGRFPHQGLFGTLTPKDDAKITDAMGITRIAHLADSPLGELSGGERQLAWIAMALAQDTELLLLDEPTTFLDLAHQIDVLDVIAELHQTHRRTIVMVLHDLNLAARYATHMVVLSLGQIHIQGKPWDIMRADVLAEVFGIRATILSDPASGAPVCVPHRGSQPVPPER